MSDANRVVDFLGVEEHEVSLENQTAKVVSESLEFNQVYEKIYKTGKKINSATVDGSPVDLPVIPAA